MIVFKIIDSVLFHENTKKAFIFSEKITLNRIHKMKKDNNYRAWEKF